ncbi:hypothetical protein MTAT_04610 [Moorella thermoacetica]|uniref:Uncharacterized protein n=1 Tax=Neomoorella thermoacetica TaxID=1525 RepID=A0AAC9HJD4_NEOTH|nr:hypothetical protein [Moorella thermoacetica]AOQ24740.1 hypothetical protein Maut_02312 [Moorella thermoacetica]TYL15722.1 hypothetical protein MTAT_04610 [Moorella thermoacetica]
MQVFRQLKPDGTPSLRIGKEVPHGDVNLAYIYVPPLKVKENVQINDVGSGTVDNLVRLFKLESLVAPDWSGLLHYLDLKPDGSFVYGSSSMPSPYFALTRKFYNNVFDVNHALYYKYRFQHYDLPGLSGLYTGNAVAVYPANGMPLAESEFYYVLLTPTGHPQIYDGIVYTNFNTDSERTYKIRYNKIVNGQVFGGHEEILNGEPVYEQAEMETILAVVRAGGDPQLEKYALEETPDDGYHIYVPQVTQFDPRTWQEFHWQLSGSFVVPRPFNTINVGTIVCSANNYTSADPFSWYGAENSDPNLNSVENRTTFVNPFAPRDVIKNTRRYWEVNLDQVGIPQLLQYDVLCLSVSGRVSLTAAQKEKLEQFVLNGGKLWVDVSNSPVLSNFFLSLSFGGTATVQPQTLVDAADPLFNLVHQLTPNEVANLASQKTIVTSAPGFTVVTTWSDGTPAMLWRQYGKGVVFVTATALGRLINNPIDGGYVANCNLASINVGATKFLINLAKWLSCFEGYSFGWVADRILPYDRLITQEKVDYNDDGTKNLTIENQSAEGLLNQVVPQGELATAPFASNLDIKSDNPNVTTAIVAPSLPARGKTSVPLPEWKLDDGYIVIDNPTEFDYTVTPEPYVEPRAWTWEAKGEGKITKPIPREGEVKYTVTATIKTAYDKSSTDVLDKTFSASDMASWPVWSSMNEPVNNIKERWGIQDGWMTCIGNHAALHGIYAPMEEFGNLEDYELEFRVRVKDTIDDDVIGFIWRSTFEEPYPHQMKDGYYLIWERNTRSYQEGYNQRFDPGLTMTNQGAPGNTPYLGPPPTYEAGASNGTADAPVPEDLFGLRLQHRKMFKTSNYYVLNNLDYYGSADPPDDVNYQPGWDGTKDGWMPLPEVYDIKLQVQGDTFRMSFKSPNYPYDGWKIEGRDSEFSKGTFGLLNWSQKGFQVQYIRLKASKTTTTTIMNSYDVPGKQFSGKVTDRNNSASSAARVSDVPVRELVADLVSQAIRDNQIDPNTISEIVYTVKSDTPGVEVFCDESGSDYVYAYVTDTSKLDPVGDNTWTVKAVRYLARDDSADGPAYKALVADAGTSVQVVESGGLQAYDGALRLLDDYKGPDILCTDFRNLNCSTHTQENIPSSLGLPFKRAKMQVAVWVASACTISLPMEHSDWCVVELNGQRVYENNDTGGMPANPNLTLSFKAGWNSLAIYYEDTNQPDNNYVLHLGNAVLRKNRSSVVLRYPLSKAFEQAGIKRFAVNSFAPEGCFEVPVTTTGQVKYTVSAKVIVAKDKTITFTPEQIAQWKPWSSDGMNSKVRGFYNLTDGCLTWIANDSNYTGLYAPFEQYGNLKNYELTMKVRVHPNHGYGPQDDDDAFGLIWRANPDSKGNLKDYYYLLWERHDRSYTDGFNKRYDTWDYRMPNGMVTPSLPYNAGEGGTPNNPDIPDPPGTMKKHHRQMFKTVDYDIHYNGPSVDSNVEFISNLEEYGSAMQYEDGTGDGWRPYGTPGFPDFYNIRLQVKDDRFNCAFWNAAYPWDGWKIYGRDRSIKSGTFGIINWSQPNVQIAEIKLIIYDGATDIFNVPGKSFTGSLSSSNNSRSTAAKVSSKIVKELMADAVNEILERNGIDLSQVIDISYEVESNTNGVTVFTNPDGLDYVYAYTSNRPPTQLYGVYTWSTDEEGKNVYGFGWAEFNLVRRAWDITLTPAALPGVAPPEVRDFRWTSLTCHDPDITMWLEGSIPRAEVHIPVYLDAGHPAIFHDKIIKADGVKSLLDINTIVKACAIPSSTPTNKVKLRLTIGAPGRVPTNKEKQVNLRFRRAGTYYLDSEGNNITLLSNLMPGGEIVAWTNYQDLLAVPVLAIKFDELRKIYVDYPEPIDAYLHNWYLRIKNGRFALKKVLPSGNYEACPELRSYVGSEVTLLYSLPEYYRQHFNPVQPWMQVTGELRIVNDRTLQAVNYPLKSIESVVVNPGQPNSVELTVVDIDRAKGLIYIDQPVRPDDKVIATYTYEQTYYTYRGFWQQDNFFHLDLNPSPGHTFSALQDKNLVIPGDFPSLYQGTKTEVPAKELLNRSIYIYLRPVAAFSNGVLIPGSVRTNAVFHTTEADYFTAGKPVYDPTAFLLARVYVRPNSSVDDILIFDTRSRGGGVDPEYLKKQPELGRDYWDIGAFDGTVVPSQGVVLIRLSKTILQEYGGHLTRAQVEESVQKHLAYGVLPLIEYI